MGCILALISLCLPRVTMIFILILTNWFSQAFQTIFWPFLGFLFMPYLTLAYIWAMLSNNGKIDGIYLVGIIISALVDLSNWKVLSNE